MKSKLLKVLRKIRSFIPESLPIGRTAFDEYCQEVIELSSSPDNDSVRFTIAAMITNLGHLDCYLPKNYFVKALKMAMAKQVASTVFIEIKTKDTERRKAEEAAAKSANEPQQ